MLMGADSTTHEFVEAVATEMRSGIECAVQGWMSRFADVVHDAELSPDDKVEALLQVLEHYKEAVGSQRPRTTQGCQRSEKVS